MTTVFRRLVPALLAPLVVLAGAPTLNADDDGIYHKIIYFVVGDEPPAFDLKDDQGGVWKSSEHFGKKYVVIYFYMGDFMPACTREAVAYRDAYNALKAEGAEVVGISGDEITSHQLFRQKYQLKQTLLADDQGAVGQAFGLAWSGGGEWSIKDDRGKEVPLKRGITESRWTWIIGKDGKIIYKSMSVKPDEDAKQVLKFLSERNKKEQERP